jgi:hypothetical protein
MRCRITLDGRGLLQPELTGMANREANHTYPVMWTQIGMFRPIRMDHTNCLQVAIKTLQFNKDRTSRRKLDGKTHREGLSSNSPELVALWECLESHPDNENLKYLTVSETTLQGMISSFFLGID